MTLSELQLHCELYLERIKELGGNNVGPHSDYFWKHAEVIRSAANPLTAFLSVMGMTLEQANLDFTLMYRDAFENVGDSESARIIQRVHDDEIRHVRLARRWLSSRPGTARTSTPLNPKPLFRLRSGAQRSPVSHRASIRSWLEY